MAEGKKSFIAYVDWGETFNALPDEKAGQLVKHLFAYVSDENPISDDVLINAVFANIKQQLKRDLVKWEGISLQRSEIGRLGGIKSGEARQSKTKQTKQLLKSGSKTKQNEHVTVNVNDIVNDNVNNNKSASFKKPELSEVKAYCKERTNDVDPDKWYDFYESKGWMIGKNKMKDWKAAVRTWETKEKKVILSFESGPGK